MSVMIEQDLREILARIDQRLDRIEQRLEKDVTDLKIGQTRLEGEIKLVEEKVNGLEKRFTFQEWINRGILICLIGAVLGGFVKIFGLVG